MDLPLNFIRKIIEELFNWKKESSEKKRVLDFFKHHENDKKDLSIHTISTNLRMSESKVSKYCELLWEEKKIDKRHIIGALVPNNLLPQYRLAKPVVS